jgi:hypothetical protein
MSTKKLLVANLFTKKKGDNTTDIKTLFLLQQNNQKRKRR